MSEKRTLNARDADTEKTPHHVNPTVEKIRDCSTDADEYQCYENPNMHQVKSARFQEFPYRDFSESHLECANCWTIGLRPTNGN